MCLPGLCDDVVKDILLPVVLYAGDGHLKVSEVICFHDEGAQAISLEAGARAGRREVHDVLERALMRVDAGDLKGQHMANRAGRRLG
jgi:hypothetical protein